MLFVLDTRARRVQDLRLTIDLAPQYFDDILSCVGRQFALHGVIFVQETQLAPAIN